MRSAEPARSYNSRVGRRTLLLFLFLVLPVFFFQNWRVGFQRVGARSGDEPHYLVLLFSLVRDFDLEVSNNYDSAEDQRGFYFSRLKLDHHSLFIHRRSRKFLRWEQIYRPLIVRVPTGEKTVRFEKRPGMESFVPGEYLEIGWHPPGYPLLLGLVSFPLVYANFPYLESYLILLQLALYSFAIARAAVHFKRGVLFTLLTAVALPAYYYSCTFYTEGVAASLYLLAGLSFYRREIAGLSLTLGLLILIKESHAPAAALFLMAFIRQERSWRKLFLLASGPLVAAFLFIGRSLLLYHRPLQPYLPWEANPHPLAALGRLLVSSHNGILAFTPVVLFFFIAPLIPRRGAREAGVLFLLVFLYHLILTSFSIHWSGGPTFAYRILVPAVTLLVLPFFALAAAPEDGRPAGRLRPAFSGIIMVFLFISALTGFYGATNLKNAYDTTPYINIIQFQKSRMYERFFRE